MQMSMSAQKELTSATTAQLVSTQLAITRVCVILGIMEMDLLAQVFLFLFYLMCNSTYLLGRC